MILWRGWAPSAPGGCCLFSILRNGLIMSDLLNRPYVCLSLSGSIRFLFCFAFLSHSRTHSCSLCLSLSIYSSIHAFYLSVCLSVCLSIYISVYLLYIYVLVSVFICFWCEFVCLRSGASCARAPTDAWCDYCACHYRHIILSLDCIHVFIVVDAPCCIRLIIL